MRMDNRESRNLRKRRYNTNVVLLAVMIGFCILAIIEIIYGQVQIKMQKERLALEQENHQTVQELKAEWDQLKGDPSVGTEVPATAGEEQTGSGETEKTLTNTEQTQNGASAQTDQSAAQNAAQPQVTVSQNSPQEKQYDMQIVFMGDSILDNEREDSMIREANHAGMVLQVILICLFVVYIIVLLLHSRMQRKLLEKRNTQLGYVLDGLNTLFSF